MNSYRTSLMAISLTMLPSVAIAHPGHGSPEMEHSMFHYVVSPIHLIPAMMATGLVILILRCRSSIKRNKMTKCPVAVVVQNKNDVSKK